MSKVTFNIQVTMEERWVDDFCSMLHKMEMNGAVGHSSVIGFYADGDGDFRPHFDIDKEFVVKPGIPKDDLFDKPEVMFDAG